MSALADPQTVIDLVALMRDLDRDGADCRLLIGELLKADRGLFQDAALEILKIGGESRAFQYVVALLFWLKLLLPVLCDPSLSHEQVLAAARAAQCIDPKADAAIARSLAVGVVTYDPCVRTQDATRLMDVLGEISDPSRILPSLMRLLRHPNSHLHSKAVKLIGRGDRSIKWVQARLAEPDPRVRANAIEALWGVDTQSAIELLLPRMHDSDNRVVGNALVGLHRIGECRSLPDFYKLAAHRSPQHRCTAAWAMGETGDPRFSEPLARLLTDSSSEVRSRALASLNRIKRIVAKVRRENPWRVSGAIHDDLKRSIRMLHLVVASPDSRDHPVVLGTQFFVTEGSQPVVSYRVTECQAPESMSVSFVFPYTGAPNFGSEPWIQSARNCCDCQASPHSWTLQSYSLPEGAEELTGTANQVSRSYIPEETDGQTSSLMPSPETIEDIFTQPGTVSSFWDAVRQAVLPGSGGTCHTIVFSCFGAVSPAPQEIVSAIAGSGQFHVVSTVPNPVLKVLCRQGHGTYTLAESPGQIAEGIKGAYRNLLAGYEIAYTPVCQDARNVRIRIQTATGWGEATIPVSAT